LLFYSLVSHINYEINNLTDIISSSHDTSAGGRRRCLIDRPTVIGFFPPVTESDLEKDSELNEVLSDFQEHFVNATSYLESKHVRVVERYAKAFTYRLDGNNVVFHPTRKIGYLIAAPGRHPKTFYGVMTDIDLGDAIDAYLNPKKPNKSK
jgi:hypothetical protein